MSKLKLYAQIMQINKFFKYMLMIDNKCKDNICKESNDRESKYKNLLSR